MIIDESKLPNVLSNFLLSTLILIRRFLRELRRKSVHFPVFAIRNDLRRDFNGRARTKPLDLTLTGIAPLEKAKAKTRIESARAS